MRNFITPHCHAGGSLDSASTPARFVEREVQLGTGAITCTDHGTLAVCPEVYDEARKAGITPILGIEGYFRDDNCPILIGEGIKPDEKGSLAHYLKYCHCTIHALNQEAYEAISRVVSRCKTEKHGSELKPIFTWADLEELANYQITLGSSCLVGMVQNHVKVHQPGVALKYYQRFRGLVPAGRFFVEVFPHLCTHRWEEGVFVRTAADNKKFWHGKKLLVKIEDKDEELTARDLAKKWSRSGDAVRSTFKLCGQKNYSTWELLPDPVQVVSVNEVAEFLPEEDGDAQQKPNYALLVLAKKYGDPILVSDDSHFAYPEDKVIQDVRLQSWKFFNSYHRMTSEEAFVYFKSQFGISEKEFESWIDNSYAWASQFGWEWKARKQLPTKFYPTDTLQHTMALIKDVGRMQWNDKRWTQRLTDEIRMLHKNGTIDLLPYFFLGQDVVKLYESEGRLTGTGRGSAAGLLLTYLLGITHINPLKYGLSKERFLTETRIKSGKLPDIDQDLPSRDLLINPDAPGEGWLYRRFPEHFAQISTDTKLRLKSSIKDVHRALDGLVCPEIEQITKQLPTPPQGIEDADFVFGYTGPDGEPVEGIINSNPVLKGYAKTYPRHWAIVQRCLGNTRGKGKHASAFVITNEPVSNFLPTTLVGGDTVPVTQYTMKQVEKLGGIKMDFLIITVLNDIERAIKLIQERVGYQPKDERIDNLRVPGLRVVPRQTENGIALYDVWDLPEDPVVFEDICAGRTETVFQFSTPSAKQWLEKFYVNQQPALNSIEAISAFTALDRPGPLDASVKGGGTKRNMLEEFAARASGEEAFEYNEHLARLIPETHGVITYQEQCQKIFQVIGNTTPEQADEFRVHVGKKMMAKVAQDREIFMPGATANLGSSEEAEKIWHMLCTFGQYGFNKSHAVCYAYTGYVCAWLKHYYPVEWWCAVLTNADRKKTDEKHWKYCGHLVDVPDLKLSGDDFEIQNGRIRAPLRMLEGVGQKAHEELVSLRPFNDIREFYQKIHDRKISTGKRVVETKETKKGIKETVKIKLGRSSLGKSILTKIVASGAADSLFPEHLRGEDLIYQKLEYFFKIKQEIEGKKKPDVVPAAYLGLTPLQRVQLKKSILSTFSCNLMPIVQAVLPKSEFRLTQHGAEWFMPREFEGSSWCPIVDGDIASEFLTPGAQLNCIGGAFKFGVIAWVSGVDWFWGGKAARVKFEVDGERFSVVRWPNRAEKKDNKGAQVPPDLDGSICLLTLSRWEEGKDFSIDEIVVLQPPLVLSSKKDDEEAE